MRLTREAKAEHHEEIVSAASKMLRQRGIDRTSLIDLMEAVGLTHGGFYRHFKSKDDLVAESTFRAFEESVVRFEARGGKMGPKAALQAYVDEYLSETHIKHPEDGCPIAAYGADAARQNDMVRDVFSEGMGRLIDLVSDGLSSPKEERRARAVELLAMLSGAVVMARATNDPKLSRQILASCRRRALRLIDEKR
jgi:TetR/AcrR family transcriptional regulator, transcriptional repressor for nem operon